MNFRVKQILLFIMMTIFCQSAISQTHKEIPLYKIVPNENRHASEIKETIVHQTGRLWVTGVTQPTLIYFAPVGKNTGTAVVICPGGGYAGLAIGHEGYDVAQKFTSMGISAFVLKYRLPDDRSMTDKKIGPLQDAQQALKMVRENASQYHINTDKIGIMGFSAGGHLAATASTHFRDEVIENRIGTSVRPDFSILIYPVITFGRYAHQGSRDNLLGADTTKKWIDYFSNEKQVSDATPITFLVHANDDNVVSVLNTLNYIEALNNNGIKNEAHIYPTGGHGFGLNNNSVKDQWFDRLTNWMKSEGLLRQ